MPLDIHTIVAALRKAGWGPTLTTNSQGITIGTGPRRVLISYGHVSGWELRTGEITRLFDDTQELIDALDEEITHSTFPAPTSEPPPRA